MELYNYKAKVVSVTDGDSIKLDIDLGFGTWLVDRQVRLLGVDTPESRTKDKIEKKFGLLSKSIVRKYLPVNKEILIKTELEGDGVDKFGRILALVVVNGAIFNDWLIENNYAVPYTGQAKDDPELVAAHLSNRQALINRGEITL